MFHGMFPALHGMFPMFHGMFPALHGMFPMFHGMFPVFHGMFPVRQPTPEGTRRSRRRPDDDPGAADDQEKAEQSIGGGGSRIARMESEDRDRKDSCQDGWSSEVERLLRDPKLRWNEPHQRRDADDGERFGEERSGVADRSLSDEGEGAEAEDRREHGQWKKDQGSGETVDALPKAHLGDHAVAIGKRELGCSAEPADREKRRAGSGDNQPWLRVRASADRRRERSIRPAVFDLVFDPVVVLDIASNTVIDARSIAMFARARIRPSISAVCCRGNLRLVREAIRARLLVGRRTRRDIWVFGCVHESLAVDMFSTGSPLVKGR